MKLLSTVFDTITIRAAYFSDKMLLPQPAKRSTETKTLQALLLIPGNGVRLLIRYEKRSFVLH